MSTHEAESAEGLAPTPALREQMRDDGFLPITCSYKPAGEAPPPCDRWPPDADGADGSKSAAQRQREQDRCDANAGKARRAVKTANDDGSRICWPGGRGDAERSNQRYRGMPPGAARRSWQSASSLVGSRVLALRRVRRRVVFKLVTGTGG